MARGAGQSNAAGGIFHVALFRDAREDCGIVVFIRSFFLLLVFMATLAVNAASPRFVYFGTYTRANPHASAPASKGIYVARLDPQTGALSAPALAAAASNPTFLARHPALPVLYAAAASPDKGGVVVAYKINPETGALTLLNQVSAGRTNGTYVAVSPDGRTVLTAHYSGGYVNSFPVRADGSLGECASHIQHTLTGTHPQQNVPHPHCSDVSPDGRFAFVADLSADRIFSYRIGAGSALSDGKVAARVKDESGARHLAFSPDGKRLYLVNELGATVVAYDYDAASGALAETQIVPTVPPGFSGRRWASEIAVRPDGKFLYASNRADDESIAAFAIDAATGKLAFVQRTGGLAQPRSFAISPDGRWLVCANQDTNDVVVFEIDAASGKLSGPRARASVPACICVLFWP